MRFRNGPFNKLNLQTLAGRHFTQYAVVTGSSHTHDKYCYWIVRWAPSGTVNMKNCRLSYEYTNVGTLICNGERSLH